MSRAQVMARIRATCETPWEAVTMAEVRWLHSSAPTLLDEVERLIAEAEEREALERLTAVEEVSDVPR